MGLFAKSLSLFKKMWKWNLNFHNNNEFTENWDLFNEKII